MDGWMEAVRRYPSSRRGRAVRRDARCFPRAGNKAPPPPPRSAPPLRQLAAAPRLPAKPALDRRLPSGSGQRARPRGASRPYGAARRRGAGRARRCRKALRGGAARRHPNTSRLKPRWDLAPGRALPPTAPAAVQQRSQRPPGEAVSRGPAAA